MHIIELGAEVYRRTLFRFRRCGGLISQRQSLEQRNACAQVPWPHKRARKCIFRLKVAHPIHRSIMPAKFTIIPVHSYPCAFMAVYWPYVSNCANLRSLPRIDHAHSLANAELGILHSCQRHLQIQIFKMLERNLLGLEELSVVPKFRSQIVRVLRIHVQRIERHGKTRMQVSPEHKPKPKLPLLSQQNRMAKPECNCASPITTKPDLTRSRTTSHRRNGICHSLSRLHSGTCTCLRSSHKPVNECCPKHNQYSINIHLEQSFNFLLSEMDVHP